MPPLDSLPNPDSLRTTMQRILNDAYDNGGCERIPWTGLLAPENSNKNQENDSVDKLINLITELPTVLISSLSLSPSPSEQKYRLHPERANEIGESCVAVRPQDTWRVRFMWLWNV